MFEERSDGYCPSTLSDGSAIPIGDFIPGDDGTGHPSRAVTALVAPYHTLQEYRNPSVNNRAAWNGFTHYKRNVQVFSHPFHWHGAPYTWLGTDGEHHWCYRYNIEDAKCAWNSNRFGGFDTPFGFVPQLYEIDESGTLVVPPPVDLDDLLSKALASILPEIRPDASLLNSLYELKDFKSLPRTISHITDSLGHLFKEASLVKEGSLLQDLGHLPMREILRRGSDVFLQWNFNIAPLLADINSVFRGIKSYQKQAAKLISDSETTKVHHYQVIVPSDQTDYTEWTDWYPLNCVAGNSLTEFWARSGRFVKFGLCKFHVELEYSYYFTPFQKQHAALLLLLDRWGINFNPQIIWNAVPWSFVVDWFTHANELIGKLRMPNMEPVIVVNKSIWSIRRDRETSCFVDAGELRGLPVSHVWETAYHRQSFDVNSSSIMLSGLTLEGLNLMESSLAAALGLSRKRRRSRRNK